MKALLIALVLLLTACGENYSTGVRTGTVVKLSDKGLLCTTTAGQLVMGGLVKQANDEGQVSMVANTFEFDVEDSTLANELRLAIDSGKPVTLEYKQWFIGPFCNDTQYVITGVRQ